MCLMIKLLSLDLSSEFVFLLIFITVFLYVIHILAYFKLSFVGIKRFMSVVPTSVSSIPKPRT
jgi:hypothetical protein